MGRLEVGFIARGEVVGMKVAGSLSSARITIWFTIGRWTGEHRGYAVKAYYQNDKSLGKTHETPLHAQKMTEWYAISANGIIRPYFFENEAENAVTVNTERYVTLIQNLSGFQWIKTQFFNRTEQ